MVNLVKSNENRLNELIYLYSQNLLTTTIVFLRGEKGLGKSEVIYRFLHCYDRVITIEPDKANESYLNSFETALNKFYKKNNATTKENETSGFSYNEQIANRLLSIFSENITIMFIRNIEQCSCNFIEFLQEICISLYKNPEKCAFIIIEQDTNYDDHEIHNTGNIQSLFSINPLVEFINFRPIPKDEILDMFLNIFDININVSQKDIDYLIESALGNISILYIIVNYLKQEEIIIRQDNKWCCYSIPEGILSNILKKYIKQKYDQLDEYLKRTLQQSSLLGKEFAVKQLQDTFSLLQADEWLSNIERISNLIKKGINSSSVANDYVFENDEIFIFVKNQIPEDKIKSWFDILIEYYKFQYNDLESSKTYSDSTIGELTNLSIKIASYYAENGDYREALDFYVKSIIHCFTTMNYRQAKFMIEKAKQTATFLKEGKQHLLWLDRRYALCYEYLGLYEIAKKYFQLCINEYSNLSNFDCEWFRYKVAFCTYYSSLVNEAFELTYRLKNDIENNSRLDSLYYDVLSLLATLYHEKSDINNTKKYYLSALNECKKNSFDREYHILLRKSDLCFEPNLSVSHVIEACNYFKSISDMKEYSKAIHNLGIAYLYMGEWDNAYKFLNEALICFNSFGSIEALYPFNGLGILSIVNEKDLNKALNFFQRADYTEMNAFKKITVWLNQSMCCQKLGDRQNAWGMIEKCEILPHCQINKDYAYYNRTIYLAKALFHKNFNNKEESLEWFIKCLDIPLENNQLSLVTKNIVLLSKELHLPVNEKTMQTSKMSHMPLISVYLEDDILFHELSFLE